jgi:VWFA-related protein
MRLRITVLPFVALVLLVRSVAFGANPVQQDSVPEIGVQDVIRVETRLVQVDVVVRDDDGPVGDLTVDDFEIFDDGEQQEISLFEITRAIDSDTPGARSEPRALPDGVVSNRPDGGGYQPTSATILLLDRLNTEAMDQPFANDQAIEFLESLDPRHQVAIYELTEQLRLVQDYTNDRDQLVRAAMGLGTEFSSQLDASYGAGATGGFEASPNEVGLDPDLVDAQSAGMGIAERGTADLDQQVAAYFVNNRIRITADVLDAIASHMSRLPGRKNLVWLAGRFPFSFSPASQLQRGETSPGTMEQLERTARAITDANVAIYPVSAVGLLAPEFNGPSVSVSASATTRRRVRFQRTVTSSGSRLEQEPDSTNTMNDIARMTGGEAYYLTNGIAEAINEAVNDTQLIYTLGFYPDAASLDRDFHELRIEVARDDVDVRHRQGYYGFGEPEAQVEQRVVPMVGLVTSPINATDLGLTATIDPMGSLEGEAATRLMVDLNDLDLEFQDGVWVGAVEIATLFVEDGDVGEGVQVGTLTINLTDDQFLDAFDHGGYELLRLRGGQGGAVQLRVVVRELTTGAAGSLWVELD